MEVRDYIMAAFAAGRKLTPLKPNTKAAYLDGWNERPLSAEEFKRRFRPGMNVGWVTFGEADIDCDCAEAIAAAKILAPTTECIFGRDGKPRSHYWFVILGEEFPRQSFTDPMRKGDTAMLVEYRGKNVQTMAPGSIHPSGEPVRFDVDGAPAEITAGQLLWHVKKIAAAALLGRYWRAGERHEAVLALAGWLGKRWHEDDVRRFITAVLAAGRDEESRRADLASTFERIAAKQPVTGYPKLKGVLPPVVVDTVAAWLDLGAENEAGTIYSDDDLGNAERLRDLIKDVRHVSAFNRFHVYRNGIWLADTVKEVEARAIDVARQLLALASRQAASDPVAAKNAVKLAKHAASAAGTSAMVQQLTRLDGVRAAHDIWDRDVHLIAARNGVVDLRSGKLLPHSPDYLITRYVDVDYYPDAHDHENLPAWNEYLDTTYVDADGYVDEELIGYLWRLLGYCLTGETSEQVFVILYGESGSGKGVLVRFLAHPDTGLLKMHATTINPAALLDGAETRHSTELAKLMNMRLVTTSEVQAGQRLATAVVKRLTGQDPITARFMRQDEFVFMPQFKLFLLANERFLVDEDGDGLWRRMHVIDYLMQFRRDTVFDPAQPLRRPIDTTLERRLLDEKAAIFSWMVQGAVAWYAEGLQPPKRVTDARDAYRTSQDVIFEFIRREGIEGVEPAAEADALAVFEKWNGYRFKAREDEITFRAFVSKMQSHGHKLVKRPWGTETFEGLGVRP